jgi:hypothetical protein
MDAASSGAPRPKISKFQFPANGGAKSSTKETLAPERPATSVSRSTTNVPRTTNVSRATTSVRTPPAKPAGASAAPVSGKPASPKGAGAWQSIFDVAEESVHKPKPK